MELLGLAKPVVAWTKESVAAEWTRRADNGPLRRHDAPSLFKACLKFFGGWRKALAECGLPLPRRRNWSRAAVVSTLQDWNRRGMHRMWIEDRTVYYAAVKQFGDWRTALTAAGLQPSPPTEKWTKSRIVHELQVWHGQPEETRGRIPRKLLVAATNYFGSFEQATIAAGIPYRKWTKERVIEMLQDRYVRGLSLNSALNIKNGLAAAAGQVYGGWHKALTAAGLESAIIRRATWTRERVINAMKELHEQGKPLNSNAHGQPGLTSAAHRYFGGWRNAVIAAGFQPIRKYWTREDVIQSVQQMLQEHGRLHSEDNPNVARAARRHFGSWTQCLVELGFADQMQRRGVPSQWSADRVIDELSHLITTGQSVKATAEANRRLFGAARRHWGTWTAALQEARRRLADEQIHVA